MEGSSKVPLEPSFLQTEQPIYKGPEKITDLNQKSAILKLLPSLLTHVFLPSGTSMVLQWYFRASPHLWPKRKAKQPGFCLRSRTESHYSLLPTLSPERSGLSRTVFNHVVQSTFSTKYRDVHRNSSSAFKASLPAFQNSTLTTMSSLVKTNKPCFLHHYTAETSPLS